jgi:hypothetical protein
MRFWMLVGLLIVSSPAMAQKQTAQFGNWNAECEPLSTGALSCVIKLEVQDLGSRPFVGTFLVFMASENITFLTAPKINYASIKTDKGDLFVCPNQVICDGKDEDSKRLVRSMRTATIMTIKARTDSGNYEFEAPLSGYRQAVAQITSWGYGAKVSAPKKP